MSIRKKLLEAVNGCFDDLSDNALVEILIDRIEQQRLKIEELHSANNAEAQKLQNIIEHYQRQCREMRSNPLYGASGKYIYQLEDKEIHIEAHSGQIVNVFQRYKNIDYVMQFLRKTY